MRDHDHDESSGQSSAKHQGRLRKAIVTNKGRSYLLSTVVPCVLQHIPPRRTMRASHGQYTHSLFLPLLDSLRPCTRVAMEDTALLPNSVSHMLLRSIGRTRGERSARRWGASNKAHNRRKPPGQSSTQEFRPRTGHPGPASQYEEGG